jgi:hypothetical protein
MYGILVGLITFLEFRKQNQYYEDEQQKNDKCGVSRVVGGMYLKPTMICVMNTYCQNRDNVCQFGKFDR